MLRGARATRPQAQRASTWFTSSEYDPELVEPCSHQTIQIFNGEAEKEVLTPGHVYRSRSRIMKLPISQPRAGQLLLVCLVLVLTLLRGPSLPWFKRGGKPFLGEEWESSPAIAGLLGFGDGEDEALLEDEEHPLATPLPIGFLTSPPRIDRTKLLSRLTKLEILLAEEDEDEDEVSDLTLDRIGANMDEHRETTPRWPPLIDRIPLTHGSHHEHEPHEKFTASVADYFFCNTHPCKLLLPAWTRPLPAAAQHVQINLLAHLAAHLNRTLVLPNAGPVGNSSIGHKHEVLSRELLAVGTCPRTPLARYFDVAPLLLPMHRASYAPNLSLGRDIGHRAVPMQPFLDWTKHRPTHPTAQMLVIEDWHNNTEVLQTEHKLSKAHGHQADEGSINRSSEPLDDATVTDADLGSRTELRLELEVATLEATAHARGRKNCLSARAPKLDFKKRPTLSVSVPFPDYNEDEECSRDAPFNTMPLANGLKALIEKTPELDSADVLVLEWDLSLALSTALEVNSGFSDNVLGLALGYSHRLETLADALISFLIKPLIVMRSVPEDAGWDSLASDNQLLCLRRFAERVEGLIAESTSSGGQAGNSTAMNISYLHTEEQDFADEEDEGDLAFKPEPKRATLWLSIPLAKSKLLLKHLGGFESSASTSNPSSLYALALASASDAYKDGNSGDAADSDSDAVCDVPEISPNFTVTGLEEALVAYSQNHSGRVSWFGRLADVLDDGPLLAIVEDKIKSKADHIIELTC